MRIHFGKILPINKITREIIAYKINTLYICDPIFLYILFRKTNKTFKRGKIIIKEKVLFKKLPVVCLIVGIHDGVVFSDLLM